MNKEAPPVSLSRAASADPGEQCALLPGREDSVSPLALLAAEAKRVFTSLGNIGKSWKKLIPAFVLAAVWIAVAVLRACGLENFPVGLLAFLSFGDAGLTGNIFFLIGGIVGKCVFAAALGAVIRLAAEKKGLPSPEKLFRFPLDGLPAFLLGAGAAILFSLFIAGGLCPTATLGLLAAALAAALSLLRGGFWLRFFRAVLVRLTGSARAEAAECFLRGCAAGCAFSALLCPFGRLFPAWAVALIAAIVLLIAAVTLMILKKAGLFRVGTPSGAKETGKENDAE